MQASWALSWQGLEEAPPKVADQHKDHTSGSYQRRPSDIEPICRRCCHSSSSDEAFCFAESPIFRTASLQHCSSLLFPRRLRLLLWQSSHRAPFSQASWQYLCPDDFPWSPAWLCSLGGGRPGAAQASTRQLQQDDHPRPGPDDVRGVV